jgi:hypothetical protein
MNEALLHEKIKYLERKADDFILMQIEFNNLIKEMYFLKHKINCIYNQNTKNENVIPEATRVC